MLRPIDPQIAARETPVAPVSTANRAISGISRVARGLGSRRLSVARLTFLLFVAAPTLATLFFALLWATPQYQSEFRVSVRAAERLQANASLPSILGLGTSQSGSDSNAVVQYILSHEILQEMAPTVDPRALYARTNIDWLSRLPEDASAEAFLRYWRRMTEAYYESSTATVVVKLSAFSPLDAVALAERTLSLSEDLVNRMSARARQDSVAIAKRQVDVSERRLSELREQIKTLRDKERLLDPRKEAESELALASKLREEMARANTDLAVMRRSMNDAAPSVVAMRNRIAALQSELARVAASTVKQEQQTRPLSSVFGSFEQLESERVFAEKAFQAALSSLQSAELDASRQQLYLATIVKPNVPQEPAYPKPLRMTALALALGLALWGLVNLVYASIRDHR
jgi:capsular polysaccharide transport system permease protein